MNERIINSRYFTWYRKAFLKKIYRSIKNYNAYYCCRVPSIYKLFICWKDLKEVKENYDSIFILDEVKKFKAFKRRVVWFHSHNERLKFLRECLSKFK